MPLVAGVSSREPTRRKTPTLALCTWARGMASSLTPLLSVFTTGVFAAAVRGVGWESGQGDKRAFKVGQQRFRSLDAQVQFYGWIIHDREQKAFGVRAIGSRRPTLA